MAAFNLVQSEIEAGKLILGRMFAAKWYTIVERCKNLICRLEFSSPATQDELTTKNVFYAWKSFSTPRASCPL